MPESATRLMRLARRNLGSVQTLSLDDDSGLAATGCSSREVAVVGEEEEVMGGDQVG